ncbi:hypothetical protein OV208_40030 [Corallococcus sp. bb12-1]|uniref:hypothetical protein n=1 Tax=Corallococcus sp. bb12-1 TaxID=2996784 RepID=UPI002270712B|nr:hypothetical protein [Corallococcus sp. bb12-1]MCY1047557.1 hypothetical protein [Corallococcus sp. bb12-1]
MACPMPAASAPALYVSDGYLVHLLLSGPSAMQGHVVASLFTVVRGEDSIRRMVPATPGEVSG